jgi:16S rRNA (cytidine1402-2'-O)-methyltransferase
MIRNNPNLKEEGPLVALVTTPIGNLKDITYRAVEFLTNADIIACEDTRNTSLLLNHYQIKPKKLVPLYAQTEIKGAKALIEEVKKNKLKLAYCSDAGMPGISDPGSILVQAAYLESVPVTILPGPTASLSALVISNIDSADFSFYGFLPTKPGQIKSFLSKLKNREEALIFYESPKRVSKTLSIMREVFGDDRVVSLVREITKVHEEVINGTLFELTNNIQDEVKGECVIIVKGSEVRSELNDDEIIKMIKDEMKSGKTISDLSKEIAAKTGVKKNRIYQLALEVNK